MVINYKDTFYKFIETFIHLGRPQKIFKEDSKYDEVIINQYKDLKRDDLDYIKASMILLDGKHFTDEAFIYFFPMLIKHILDQNGHIEAVIKRLKEIDMKNFNLNEIDIIYNMISNLEEIQRKTDQDAEEIILIF